MIKILFKYRAEYRKIALDMLSLLPNMGKMNRLEDEFAWYQDDDQRLLYLWQNGNHNWCGLLGIENGPHNVVVRLMVLTPESASMGSYCQMLDELSQLYGNKRIVSSLQTVHFFREWEERRRQNE